MRGEGANDEVIARRSSRVGMIATGLAYFVAALGSMLLTLNDRGFGTIWPASGILVAALLIVRPRDAAGHLLAAAAGSIAANLLAGVGPANALAFTAANIIEGAIVVALCRRWHGDAPPDMTAPRQVGRLALATMGGALCSATLATFISRADDIDFFLSWFVTVSLGMMIVTPLILTGWTLTRRVDRVRIDRSPGEIAALLGMMALASLLVFGQSAYPILFVPMLAQIAVTYRLGPFGAAAGVVIVAGIASVMTAQGFGPITSIHLTTSALLFLQFYLLALLMSALPLASLLAKRDVLVRQLRLAHEDAARTATLAVAVADTDELTGLASRRCILTLLDRALARGPVAVALLDVDHFKAVNDSYGHQSGDRVLRRVGDAIAEALGTTHRAGRFGGEEFLAILHVSGVDAAMAVAERVRRAVEASTQDRDEPAVTISIGVSVAARGDTAEALIHRADRALYGAKLAGRNRVRAAELSLVLN
ncbi:GGDEF domain-containing protein [Sphingomonas adhaesiva]|uniref:GGDEF domain-containing protein n=1 Tax=Sphingomonas adhaesiva TaxID=28212 RepID=UPI002FF5F5F3